MAQEVTTFSPRGTIKDVRQVRAQFSESMVKFGDPQLPSPFDIECSQPGKAYWEDDKNWVYDYSADLPAGIRCTFTLKKDLKTLSNKALKGQQKFDFSTGGPIVRDSIPGKWGAITEDQYFVLALDAKPDVNSIKKLAYFKANSIEEKIPLDVIEGDQKNEILKIDSIKNSYNFSTWPKNWSVIVVKAKRNFPSARYNGEGRVSQSKIHLVWPTGITSETGVKLDHDESYEFQVRPDFYVTFSCERERAESDCLPISPLTLSFSSPVAISDLNKIFIKSGDKVWKPNTAKKDSDSEEDESYEEDTNAKSGLSFIPPFPPLTNMEIILPSSLKDTEDRLLVNVGSFPLKIKTADYPPLAKFSSEFGIIELNAEPAIPVTLRNLEPEVKTQLLNINPMAQVGDLNAKVVRATPKQVNKIISWLSDYDNHANNYSTEGNAFLMQPSSENIQTFQLKKPNGAKAFEVVGIPLKKPGFYIAQVESPKLGESLKKDKSSYYAITSALVTNMVVHFKTSFDSSMAWVTSLDKGQPVAGALVTIRDCNGNIIKTANSDKSGIANFGLVERFQTNKEFNCNPNGKYAHYRRGYYVIAEKGEDFTFTHSSWDNGIEPYRFNLYSGSSERGPIAHTVFDRTLLRAGETVHMKHYIRDFQNFKITGVKSPPLSVEIYHSATDQREYFPLKWSASGTATTEWKIPQEAKLGAYDVNLSVYSVEEIAERRKKSNYFYASGFNSGRFEVQEFRLPMMKASIFGPTEALIGDTKVPVDVRIGYLTGGPASNLPIQVRYNTSPMTFRTFENFDGYQFANSRERGSSDAVVTKTLPYKLDKSGMAKVKLELPKPTLPETIEMETEYSDPSGEIQTVSSKFQRYTSNVLIGLKLDNWMARRESFKFAAAVVDLKGKPVANAPVQVDLYQNKTYRHRKKIIGGFYSYETKNETKRLASACSGKTDEKGYLFCETASPASGDLFLEAKTKDKSGKDSSTYASFWLWDREPWMFETSDDDRMDLIPERKTYNGGETAKFQVRMPFAKATALVTVEREGVIDSFVTELTKEKPVVEVPVKKEYSPNMFVSVLAVRGRVGDVQPTAMVDLGRPAYKLGITEIKVNWKEHELKVQVTPEKTEYKVRDKAAVKVSVRTPDGKVPSPNTEVTLVAVDEALLELKGNSSWNLIEAIMKPRGYEVQTLTAQMQVVGKRHYGLKAQAPGGGGGRSTSRELFDTLLYWKPNVKLDANGEAKVMIPLNDSLSSFKIVAIASSNMDLFGKSDASIRTYQPLSIFSGIPPLAREGDKLSNEITVKNGIKESMEVNLSGKVNGETVALNPNSLKLKAGESKTVKWNITIPQKRSQMEYLIEAKDSDGKNSDSIKTVQKIKPAVPVRVVQATLTQLDGKSTLAVAQPKDSVVGAGGIQVNLSPTLTKGLTGVEQYMMDYPYNCLEQKTSRAITLNDKKMWKEISSSISTYLDGDGFAKYFPNAIYGSDTLTSYILTVTAAANFEIPSSARSRMLESMHKFIAGKTYVQKLFYSTDSTYSKVSALEALSMYKDMTVDEAKPLIVTEKMTNWPTSVLISMHNVLRLNPNLPERDDRLKKVTQMLRSRLNFRGTTMAFSTEVNDRLWWMMVSSDLNANRLVHAIADNPEWKNDVPRLMNGIISRQSAGHWDLTTANAWGAIAVRKFSSIFEKTPVTGVTSGTLSGKTSALKWSAKPEGGALEFPWPTGESNLVTQHQGTGKPWTTIQSKAAIPLKSDLFKGYQIKKTWTPVQQKKAGVWTRGDVIRITLNLDAQADMTWVVVNDPIPAGATILGSGLGRDSKMLSKIKPQVSEEEGEYDEEGGEGSEDGEYEDDTWTATPSYIERTFEGYRAYYDYVPKGKWSTEFTVRLNQSGQFGLPPTRVEAMYAPEAFGEIPNADMTIVE